MADVTTPDEDIIKAADAILSPHIGIIPDDEVGEIVASITRALLSERSRHEAEIEALRKRVEQAENMHLPEATAAAIRGHLNCKNAFEAMQARAWQAEATIVAAWNAFSGHVADTIEEANALPAQLDGDLAKQIRELTRQRETAERQLAERDAELVRAEGLGNAAGNLREAIEAFERECLETGGYMPAIATVLRIHADEMADKYPDDTNGGGR